MIKTTDRIVDYDIYTLVNQDTELLFSLDFNISIKALSNIKYTDAKRIIYSTDGVRYINQLDNIKSRIKTIISYPLSSKILIEFSEINSVADILCPIAKKYAEIYSSKKNITKYGVWGHGIEDLYFEKIHFYSNGGIIISIGS